jgi:uncharacterized protein GlcG (DUF336 family)
MEWEHMLKRMLIVGATACLTSTGALAGNAPCPNVADLKGALQKAISAAHGQLGLGLNMWATVVAADGRVCALAYSSDNAIQGQWLASRVISAQKAFTAATLSLGPTSNSGSSTGLSGGKLAISTANLYSAVQPDGSLFGLQESNPVAAAGAYGDTLTSHSNSTLVYTGPTDTSRYGGPNDPMIGDVNGGINVFGGGLALYAPGGNKVGGVGVSGDSSCTDHLISWHLRHLLGLDHLGTIKGVNPDAQRPDNIIFDIGSDSKRAGASVSGWGHPYCGGVSNLSNNTTANGIAAALPPVTP